MKMNNKVIHYCWFGHNPLPSLAIKCIESWKKYLPDYEIRKWNEDNFDVNIIPYTAEAYKAKKYAFVSDYARFWILYNYGGLYFDTDVEIIKSMDRIIEAGPFMGTEDVSMNQNPFDINPGLGLFAVPKMPIYKKLLDFYEAKVFSNYSGDYSDTVVTATTKLMKEQGYVSSNRLQLIAGINIYPADFFCPKHVVDGHYVLDITDNTVSIHHYNGSWLPKHKLIIVKIKNILGMIFGYKRLYSIISILRLGEIREKIGF